MLPTVTAGGLTTSSELLQKRAAKDYAYFFSTGKMATPDCHRLKGGRVTSMTVIVMTDVSGM